MMKAAQRPLLHSCSLNGNGHACNVSLFMRVPWFAVAKFFKRGTPEAAQKKSWFGGNSKKYKVEPE